MQKRPWYISASLSGLAWIAGFLTALALGVATKQFFPSSSDEHLILSGAVLGGIAFTGYKTAKAPFRQDICSAVMLGGVFTITFGTNSAYSIESAASVAFLLALFAVFYIPQTTFRFIISSLALILTATALSTHWPNHALSIFTLFCLPLGTVLALLPPPKVDTRAESLALLLAIPVFWGFAPETMATTNAHLISTGLSAALLLGILFLMRARLHLKLLITILFTALFASWALPTGGTTALLIMALGWAMGDRALAIIGSITTGYFLILYYSEIDFSLIIKSYIFLSVGAGLLVPWALSSRKKTAP